MHAVKSASTPFVVTKALLLALVDPSCKFCCTIYHNDSRYESNRVYINVDYKLTAYQHLQTKSSKVNAQTMFCLAMWSPTSLSGGLPQNRLLLVAKLGGNFVGCIHVDSSLSTFKMLQDMQVQASRLMGHPTRFPRDVLFWQGETCLLGHDFAYREKLDLREEARIKTLLDKAKRGGLSMMWNEDDSAAERACRYLGYARYDERVCIDVEYTSLPNELLFLENRGVTCWEIYVEESWLASEFPHVFRDTCGGKTLDGHAFQFEMLQLIGFLSKAQRCEQIYLRCGDDWGELFNKTYHVDSSFWSRVFWYTGLA